MLKLLPLLTLFCHSGLAQFQGRQPATLWFDKPMTKADTTALIKSHYSKILVYEYHVTAGPNDKDTYDTTLLGTWKLQMIKSGFSAAWSSPFYNWDTLTSQTLKRNKIIQVIGGGDHKFILTHHLNKNGQIIKTDNKIMSKYETRYEFYKIHYTYSEGLLVEASYYKAYYSPASMPYMRYIFKYSE